MIHQSIVYRPTMDSPQATHLSHLAHSHPLKLLQERIDQDSTCAGCKAQLLTGPSTAPYYACQSCRFYLHTRCAIAPKSGKFLSVHSRHDLSLGYQAFRTRKLCDVCKSDDGSVYIVGLFYECRVCNFDAHISCVAPWRANSTLVYHFAHSHPLELLQDVNRCDSICSGCKSNLFTGPGAPSHLACRGCGFYLHFRCAAAPDSQHFPSVHSNHPLSLGFHAVRGGKLCDVCDKRNATSINDKYIVGLFYECRACDFDAHISCVEPWRGNGSGRSDEASSQDTSDGLSSQFENLRINNSNTRELWQGKDGTSCTASTPPICHKCQSNKQFPEVTDELLDLFHQVAQSRTDPDEYQRLLQHFKDTFPTADANIISAMALHLRYSSNQMVYKSMMVDLSTLRSYIRRVLDPRSAPPINLSFLLTSSPATDQIVTGRPV